MNESIINYRIISLGRCRCINQKQPFSYLQLNLSTTANLGTEVTGHCGEVAIVKRDENMWLLQRGGRYQTVINSKNCLYPANQSVHQITNIVRKDLIQYMHVYNVPFTMERIFARLFCVINSHKLTTNNIHQN